MSRGDQETMLNQFRRLMDDLARVSITRNCFQRWEIDLLLDIQTCALAPSARREVLAQYRRAVERQFDKGADAPLKLSEFLDQRRARHARS
jgi:hypothetical protein